MSFEFCPEVLHVYELLDENAFTSFSLPQELDPRRVSEGRNRCALDDFH
jgi:hypothetical protein